MQDSNSDSSIFHLRDYEDADSAAVSWLHSLLSAPGEIKGEEPQHYLSQRGELVVAEVSGRVVGFGCFECYNSAADMIQLRVHPTFRGLGLGHELLEWLECRAEARGLGALRVEVPVGGGAVRQLIESAGYSEAPESLPLSDVVLYEKRLSTLSE